MNIRLELVDVFSLDERNSLIVYLDIKKSNKSIITAAEVSKDGEVLHFIVSLPIVFQSLDIKKEDQLQIEKKIRTFIKRHRLEFITYF